MGENNSKSRRLQVLILVFEQNAWKYKANGLKSKGFHITSNKEKKVDLTLRRVAVRKRKGLLVVIKCDLVWSF